MATNFGKIVSLFVNRLKHIFEFTTFYVLKYKKSLIFVLLLLIIATSWFGFSETPLAHAADGGGKGDIEIMGLKITLDDVLDVVNRLLFVVAYALGWVASFLFGAVVYVASFQEIVDSLAVTRAWTLVRDSMNMFFVIILLVIAFAEILQIKQYSIKAVLPKVLLAAILVNFSKLICAIAIDFAQVVMMTFVNGFAQTAGGNLASGLGLTRLMELNTSSQCEANTDMTWTQLTGLVLAVFYLVMVVVVVMFILLILVFRIAALWLLVVLSPAAFIFHAMPSGTKMKNKANEWTDKFVNYVSIGPIMAFFLWMSLLVMGNAGGVIQKDKSLEFICQQGATGMQGFDQFTSSMVGLALLAASLLAAQEVGGVAGQIASKGLSTAKKVATSMPLSVAKFADDRTMGLRNKAIGFREQMRAKSERRTASQKEAGAGLYAKKERLVAGAKEKMHDLKEGTLSLAGLDTGSRAYRKAIAEGASEEEAQQAKESVKKTRKSMVGLENKTTASAIESSRKKKAMEEAEKNLAAMGLDTKEDRQQALSSGQVKGEEFKALNLKMAEKGEFETNEQVANARKQLSGDDLKAFEDNLKKNQKSMYYSKEDGTIDETKIEKDIDSGDLDIRRFSVDDLGNEDLMVSIANQMGAGNLSKSLAKAGERSDNHNEAAQTSMKAVLEQAKQQKGENPEEYEKAQKAYAGMTGDIKEAFTGDDGEIDTIQLKSYLAGASQKQLEKTKIDESDNNTMQAFASAIQRSSLKRLARSNEGQAHNLMNTVISQKIDSNPDDPALVKIASDHDISAILTEENSKKIKQMEIKVTKEKSEATGQSRQIDNKISDFAGEKIASAMKFENKPASAFSDQDIDQLKNQVMNQLKGEMKDNMKIEEEEINKMEKELDEKIAQAMQEAKTKAERQASGGTQT